MADESEVVQGRRVTELWPMGFFEMEEDGVLGEWETHFGIRGRSFEENQSGKLPAGSVLRPDCESG